MYKKDFSTSLVRVSDRTQCFVRAVVARSTTQGFILGGNLQRDAPCRRRPPAGPAWPVRAALWPSARRPPEALSSRAPGRGLRAGLGLRDSSRRDPPGLGLSARAPFFSEEPFLVFLKPPPNSGRREGGGLGCGFWCGRLWALVCVSRRAPHMVASRGGGGGPASLGRAHHAPGSSQVPCAAAGCAVPLPGGPPSGPPRRPSPGWRGSLPKAGLLAGLPRQTDAASGMPWAEARRPSPPRPARRPRRPLRGLRSGVLLSPLQLARSLPPPLQLRGQWATCAALGWLRRRSSVFADFSALSVWSSAYYS